MKMCCIGGFCGTGQRHDDEDSKEKLYTLATFVDVVEFKVRLSTLVSLTLSWS